MVSFLERLNSIFVLSFKSAEAFRSIPFTGTLSLPFYRFRLAFSIKKVILHLENPPKNGFFRVESMITYLRERRGEGINCSPRLGRFGLGRRSLVFRTATYSRRIRLSGLNFDLESSILMFNYILNPIISTLCPHRISYNEMAHRPLCQCIF